MRVFEAGGAVAALRFVPGGGRLLVGTATPRGGVAFGVLDTSSGGRVPLGGVRAGTNCATAVHPSGGTCYVAWAGHLSACRTADGEPLPVPAGLRAHHVVAADTGDRLLMRSGRKLVAATTGPDGGEVSWQKTYPQDYGQLAGFLPGGGRFVTFDTAAVRVRSFDTGAQLGAGRHKPGGQSMPQVSPDGATLGLGDRYRVNLWDLTDLGAKPRRVGDSRRGELRAFAFRPAGRTVAVIDRAPTLVKLYDLATLTRVRAYDWRLGPLTSLAYSPDGTLGAAGSRGGRVVIWDSDE